MDCLAWLRNILYIFGKYENINYMIVTQDLVNNSIVGLHIGRGIVRILYLYMFCRVEKNSVMFVSELKFAKLSSRKITQF